MGFSILAFSQLLLFLSSAFAGDPDTTQVKSSLYYGKALEEWLRSKPGGFVSEKIETRSFNPEDRLGALGIFALEDIAKGETVIVLPRMYMLHSFGAGDVCVTARRLLEEYRKGDQAEFAPYAQYLMDARPRGQLPSAWSEAAVELFQKVMGTDLLPPDIDGYSFEVDCGGSGDPDEEHAYLSMIQRSWDDKMLPMFDLINHRNGKWTNIDSTSAHEPWSKTKELEVYATREIKAGEQLFLSYNECTDCQHFKDFYRTQKMVKEFAFIEDYPQVWQFPAEPDVWFEVDDNADPHNEESRGEPRITKWLGGADKRGALTLEQMHRLRGFYRRLQSMNKTLEEGIKGLDLEHERNLILEYYQATNTALELALKAPVSSVPALAPHDYHPLVVQPSPLDGLELGYCSDSLDLLGYKKVVRDYELVDKTSSFYQDFEIYCSAEDRDCSLHMDGHLHSAASFRPHYHEVLVHFPASYLSEIKRVIFLGGGDSMILPEILKYPSLELVVGLELDQSVVRECFTHFGTEPAWEDERVEWWYGDAAKSLKMLPKDYYGSFDLVIVDLPNSVVDFLTVTKDLDIMNAAVLLMKNDGVIVANDDFHTLFGALNIKYNTYLHHLDVPILCEQMLLVGSHTIDFLTHPRTDHHVDTLFYEPFEDLENSFGYWSEYMTLSSSDEDGKLCMGKDKNSTIAEQLQGEPQHGILMIIEADDTTVDISDPQLLIKNVGVALKNTGLDEFSHFGDSSVKKKIDSSYSVIWILQEGYIVVRAWPDERYCAFDFFLWNSFDRQNTVRAALIEAVGSNFGKSSSSFRIVTGSISGLPKSGKTENVGIEITRACSGVDGDEDQSKGTDKDVINALAESISLIQGPATAVALVCSDSCDILDVLASRNPNATFFPIPVCSSLTTKERTEVEMESCRDATHQRLAELVRENGRVNGLVFSPEVPKAMGQLFHKILSDKLSRTSILADSYVVLSGGGEESFDSNWRWAFVQLFRTDFELFDPAQSAAISLQGNNAVFDMFVFSNGDDHFMSHVSTLVHGLEEKHEIKAELRLAKKGYLNYIPDFEASKEGTLDTSTDDSTLSHWEDQKPLGFQNIIQYDFKDELSLSALELATVFKSSITLLEVDGEKSVKHVSFDLVSDLGGGCLAWVSWPEGNAVMLWDGGRHILINVLTSSRTGIEAEKLTTEIEERISTPFAVSVIDEHPRGSGRVVSFPEYLDMGNPDYSWRNRG